MSLTSRKARPHDITLLNKLKEDDSGKMKYQRVYIDKVRLLLQYGVIMNDVGKQRSDDAIVTIDLTDLHAFNNKDEEVTYLDKKTFQNMAENDEDTSGYFTFQEEGDFFVEGDQDFTTLQDFKSKHRTFTVTGVKPRRFGKRLGLLDIHANER